MLPENVPESDVVGRPAHHELGHDTSTVVDHDGAAQPGQSLPAAARWGLVCGWS